MSDPFSILHEAIWTAFDADPDLPTLVKAKNRIKFEERDSLKASVSDSDLPEVILIPRSGIGNLTATSSSVTFDLGFEWLISTGDYRLSHRLFPTMWAIYRFMVKFNLDTAATLQYNSSYFVNSIKFNSGSVGESDAERNRGLRGFSSILSFTCNLKFPKGNL
jgi:hypothetical protein